jgi:hypothetical protein
MPAVVHATIVAAACPCILGVVVALVWDPINNRFGPNTVTVNCPTCGCDTLSLTMPCSGLAGFGMQGLVCPGNLTVGNPSGTCSPVDLTFTGTVSAASCLECNGPITIHVTA